MNTEFTWLAAPQPVAVGVIATRTTPVATNADKNPAWRRFIRQSKLFGARGSVKGIRTAPRHAGNARSRDLHARHQHHQDALDRRRREGEQRPPRHADGARATSRSRSGRATSATTRSDPKWIGRDRFVLSCGHASMLLYSMLHLVGLRPAARRARRTSASGAARRRGTPSTGTPPGVETTTGPLGQGIGNAVGIALAAKLKAARFGERRSQGMRVFAICSDGDVMEGVSARGVEHRRPPRPRQPRRLLRRQPDHDRRRDRPRVHRGRRQALRGVRLVRRSASTGTTTRRSARRSTSALAQKDKPVVHRRAHAHRATARRTQHDTAEAHGAPLGKDEIARDEEGDGLGPGEDVLRARRRSTRSSRARADELAKEHAGVGRAARRVAQGERASSRSSSTRSWRRTVPADLYEQLLKAAPGEGGRDAQHVERDPAGRRRSSSRRSSAARPTSRRRRRRSSRTSGGVARGKFDGRNLHFGIREHGMGAICNGMALSAASSRTARRSSSSATTCARRSASPRSMEQQCLWIYTHDSRLPRRGRADAPARRAALGAPPHPEPRRRAPGGRARDRGGVDDRALAQERPDGVRAHAPEAAERSSATRASTRRTCCKGAYVAQEATGGKPDVVIVATGSEVQLAVGARERLEKAGKKVRVVCALCLEVFAKQDDGYRDAVLPHGVPTRVDRGGPHGAVALDRSAIDGLAIGIDHYGASAPDKVLAREVRPHRRRGDREDQRVDGTSCQADRVLRGDARLVVLEDDVRVVHRREPLAPRRERALVVARLFAAGDSSTTPCSRHRAGLRRIRSRTTRRRARFIATSTSSLFHDGSRSSIATRFPFGAAVHEVPEQRGILLHVRRQNDEQRPELLFHARRAARRTRRAAFARSLRPGPAEKYRDALNTNRNALGHLRGPRLEVLLLGPAGRTCCSSRRVRSLDA